MTIDLSTPLPGSPHSMVAALDPNKPVHVIPYRHEEPLFWISAYFAVSIWLILIVVSLGFIIPIMLLLGLLGMFAHSLLIAWLKGNSVKVSAEQYPELYLAYTQTCMRLGMAKQPELYLAQADGMLNAMATRFMRRDYVVLLSAVVDALEDRPQAIKFYMGHELGHIKRKHLSRHWWLWPGMLYPLLSPAYSRAREYTCDRYGFASCDNLDDAKRALAVLVAGPELWKKLNLGAFEAQSKETGGFWMAVNELTADYPWLCKRMMVLENRSAVFPRRSFWAWMIALLSPRMGYGGAIIGFMYWLVFGILILVLVVALAFPGAFTSVGGLFGKNPVVKLWEKILEIDGDKEVSGRGEDNGAATADAAKNYGTTADDDNLITAFNQLAEILPAIDGYMESNKNRSPSQAAFDKLQDVDKEGVEYRVMAKADAKQMPGVQLSLQKSMQCETCEEAEPKIQFRKDKEGMWTCHVQGISKEMLEKNALECEITTAN